MINIIQTGSEGNGVIVDKKIMIDCGCSFKKIEEHLQEVKIILLTHKHGDHFNKKTISRIALEYPEIKFGCGIHMKEHLLHLGVKEKNIDIYSFEKEYDYGSFKLNIEEAFHNVVNIGYTLYINDKVILYLTDTNEVPNIDYSNYDIVMLEFNYEPIIVNEILRLEKEEENKFPLKYEKKYCGKHYCNFSRYRHLGNDQSAKVVEKLKGSCDVYIMHVSQETNCLLSYAATRYSKREVLDILWKELNYEKKDLY